MFKKTFILAAGMTMLLCACTEKQAENLVQEPEATETVTLKFSPYEMDAMTRAATSISNYCTHLDVWITEGGNTIDLHQTSTDSNFGTVQLPLNRLKTYSLVAVAHKANGAATLSNGIIAFPEEKVSHSMIYTTTFSPGTTTSLSCVMTRIVGQFRFEIADEVPDDAYTISFALGSTFTRWNVAGTGANAIDRTATFENFNRDEQTHTAAFSLYIIPTNLTSTDELDVTVTAYYENGDEYETKSFENVPIKAGYKTTYHGQFFTTEAVTGTFTVEEWNSFDTVEY